MHFFFALCLAFILSLLPFSVIANAEELIIYDLLSPDLPSMNDEIQRSEELSKKPKQTIQTWDDLLGPEDNFPFLPDNHRDSGTGKFMSFD